MSATMPVSALFTLCDENGRIEKKDEAIIEVRKNK